VLFCGCRYTGKLEFMLLCQQVKREALQCPNASKRSDKGAGYKSLAVNLKQFHDIGEVHDPHVSRLCNLNEGESIEAILAAHSAQWHKSCRNLYNNTKLERALKRNAQAVETDECSDDNNSTQSLLIPVSGLHVLRLTPASHITVFYAISLTKKVLCVMSLLLK